MLQRNQIFTDPPRLGTCYLNEESMGQTAISKTYEYNYFPSHRSKI